MLKTTLSKKGQVVIPKPIRDMLGLSPGSVMRVWVEGKRIILEPVESPPDEVFVEAGYEIAETILEEAKATSDKTRKLLEDLGVVVD